MTEQYNRDQRIAKIRENHSMLVYDGYEDDVPNVIDFLLSEIDRLQREYADERESHNAHMEELLRIQQERDKAIEEKNSIQESLDAVSWQRDFYRDELRKLSGGASL